MFRLKKLKIEKYRNVEPGTELTFSDSYNIVLGRNGSGKTTLLEKRSLKRGVLTGAPLTSYTSQKSRRA